MVFGALSAIEAGHVLEAERLLARARAVLADRDWSFHLPMTAWGTALLAWRAGDAPECIAQLGPAVARVLEMGARPLAAPPLFDLAEAALDAGDAARAAQAAEDLRAVAKFTGRAVYEGLAAAGAAWASLAAGETEPAARSARTAIELLSGTGWRAHLARSYYALGRSLPADARTEAVAALERAAALHEQCGSTWRRDRTLDALRRLGTAGRRAAAAALGPDSLTRREREVARLAAGGMSAKEIAETLFVGKRTVESHLARVYAKLGVDSKLQLVRRAAELGLS
jgi:DNA-binding CsgD family transcriptional regulator